MSREPPGKPGGPRDIVFLSRNTQLRGGDRVSTGRIVPPLLLNWTAQGWGVASLHHIIGGASDRICRSWASFSGQEDFVGPDGLFPGRWI